MQYFITIILGFLLYSPSYSTPLKDFIASYALYHNEMYIGQSLRRLSTGNQFLTFSSIAESKGIAAWFYDITINEESKLQFKDQRLNFFSYSYNEKKNNEIKNYQLHLNKQEKLHNSHTNEIYPLTNNLHDTLGFTIAIMHDLQSGLREMKYTIAEKDKLKTYHIKFIEKENLTTNYGTITTLKMEHYDPKTSKRFTLWCAEKLDFLPVRIRKINHKGKETLLNLTQFNQKTLDIPLEEEEID